MRRNLVFSVRARTLTLLPVLALAAALAAPASASQLVNRDVRKIKLSVNTKGEALVSYRTVRGRTQHVLAWGAINARQPNPTLRQARFKLDYAGGWGKYHKPYWKTFRKGCGAYDGPALPWLVTACKAPDGSYWALQKWQVQLPDLGFTPWTAGLRQWELHLSHWSTDLAKLEVWQDWIYHGRFHHLFGRYTYLGKPVYPDEYFTRDFNLKHEWLGQVVFYLNFAAGGPAGMVLFRAACVTLFCAITGWVVYRRTGDFYAGLLAALAAATIARSIASDRPYIVTYLLLAIELLILERRRALWLLPALGQMQGAAGALHAAVWCAAVLLLAEWRLSAVAAHAG